MTRGEAGVAAVRAQMRSLAAKQRRTTRPRVQVRRLRTRTPSWRITARLGRMRPSHLSFTPRQINMGKERIVLPEGEPLEIVSVGFEDDTLTLCVSAAKQKLADVETEIARANQILGVAAQTLEAMTEPARRIAATRAIRAVSKVIEQAPMDAVAAAASASSDIGVLVRALGQPNAIETLKADDPLAPARVRGFQERERLLSVEGGAWTTDEVARHLNLTRQAVNRRRQQGALIGLDAGRHGYLYPAWQFVREGTLRGLEAFLEALRHHDPWMQHAFVVTPNARLDDVTPLEAMRRNQLEDVLTAARAFGEHGAA